MKKTIFIIMSLVIYSSSILASSINLDIPESFASQDDLAKSNDEEANLRLNSFITNFNDEKATLIKFGIDLESNRTILVYTEKTALSPIEMIEAIYKRFDESLVKYPNGTKLIKVDTVSNINGMKLQRSDFFFKANDNATLSYLAKKISDDELLMIILGFGTETYDPELEQALSTLRL